LRANKQNQVPSNETHILTNHTKIIIAICPRHHVADELLAAKSWAFLLVNLTIRLDLLSKQLFQWALKFEHTNRLNGDDKQALNQLSLEA